ncbi:MAG: glycosyltransferase family 4 protein [Acidimicrobiales bacterium]
MKGSRRHRRHLVVITNWRDRTHPSAGGAELVCERLARSFVQRGHDVVLLTAAVAGQPRKEKVADGYWIVRRGGRFTVFPWALLWLLTHRKYIRGVIDSQNGIPFFSPLAVRRKTPVLMLLHHVHTDQFAMYFHPLVARAGAWLERRGSGLVYRNRTIVAVSPSTRKGVRLRLGLKGDIVVIPPGSDAIISDLPVRGRSECPRIVCVGRLVAHKDVAAIVGCLPSVLPDFPDLELHLIGDGPERPFLEDMVEELGLAGHVAIHGPLDAIERDQLLCTAWLSVSASKGEGWGVSVIEANSFGVPVLAYRRPGLQDSIRHEETGWLIEEGSPLGPAVCDALHVLADEPSAIELAKTTRQWASQFTWDSTADQVRALLRAEAGRLSHAPNDRRTVTDLATVVRIPVELFPNGEPPLFRETDRCILLPDQLIALLRNTDTETARVALRRAGLSPSVIEDERVQITVARPIDLVSPATSGTPVVRVPHVREHDARAG